MPSLFVLFVPIIFSILVDDTMGDTTNVASLSASIELSTPVSDVLDNKNTNRVWRSIVDSH